MRTLRAAVAFVMICLPFNMRAQNKDGLVNVPDTLDAAYVKITGSGENAPYQFNMTVGKDFIRGFDL